MPAVMSMHDEKILTAVDLGTSKTAVLVARLIDDGERIEILAHGISPTRGFKHGVVVDIEETVAPINKAVEDSQVMSGNSVRSVYINVTGSHIKSLSSEGIASTKNNEVVDENVERAMETARAVKLADGYEVLHNLPKNYSIDEQAGIKNPIGMSGCRLRVDAHLVIAPTDAIKNLKKCIRRCGLDIDGIFLSSIASDQAVLSDDERDLGVCLLDIGSGTTDIIVYHCGQVMHTSVIPIAGDCITHDIATVLRTPLPKAEEIKLKYGCAHTQHVGEEESIEVPGVADRPTTRCQRLSLVQIIEARGIELFNLIHQELQRHELDRLAVTGYVLTGGSAKLDGIVDLAESVLQAPVRIGTPQDSNIEGVVDVVRGPIYATGVGLLQLARGQNVAFAKKQETNKFLHRWAYLWQKSGQWLRESL